MPCDLKSGDIRSAFIQHTVIELEAMLRMNDALLGDHDPPKQIITP